MIRRKMLVVLLMVAVMGGMTFSPCVQQASAAATAAQKVADYQAFVAAYYNLYTVYLNNLGATATLNAYQAAYANAAKAFKANPSSGWSWWDGLIYGLWNAANTSGNANVQAAGNTLRNAYNQYRLDYTGYNAF